MLPFTVDLRTGEPIFDQVVFAVTRAIVTGQLREGDAFPSVRTISQELRINPNTAHKIVAALVDEGLLTVRPGIGTVVACGRPASATARATALDDRMEHLIVDAKKHGWSLQDVIGAIRRQWARMTR